MDADVAIYLAQCLIALSTGIAGGLLHRHFIKLAEAMTTL